MTPLPLAIAFAHLWARKRQTTVSIGGVTLGVAIFIGIGGMMNGFHSYFLSQLVETNPHIVITDEFREAAPQPLSLLHPDGAIEIRRVLPRDPVRGISGAAAILDALNAMSGVAAAPTLSGQIILRRAGRDYAITGIGVDAARELRVTDIVHDMVAGSFDALASEPNGLILGRRLAERWASRSATASSRRPPPAASPHSRSSESFTPASTRRTRVWESFPSPDSNRFQARPRVVNEIHIRLADIERSIPLAQSFERRWGFKAAPWEETYARILDVFALQDKIIYLTTTSILVVAAFGIFNVISTIVMEKARDIAIMRSIGMPSGAVVTIFVVEGLVVGVAGMILGWFAGWGLGALLHLVPAPTDNPGDTLPVKLSLFLFVAASVIALLSAVGAAWLPARRAARADPLTIIRGAA